MTAKSKVLLVTAGRTTTADIMNKLLLLLSDRAQNILISKDALNVGRDDIKGADTVIIVRGADYYLSKICDAAYSAKKCCILYLDDDLLALYDKGSPYFNYLMKCIKNSNVFWTSNINIASRYKNYLNKDTKLVVANVIEPWKKLAQYKECEENIKIVFAGSPAHEPVIAKYLIPAVKHIYDFRKDIKLILVGYRDTSVDGVEPFIETTPWFDNAEEYRKYVLGIRAQIGVAIIENTPFANCKFFNKYLEYTKLGLMGIYSNYEPYNKVIRNKENGLLVDNSVENWEQAIIDAINNPEMRRICVDNAQKDMLEKFSNEKTIEDIRRLIPEIEEYKSKPYRVKYNGEISYIRDRIISRLRTIKRSINNHK